MAEFDPNVWYHISEERVTNASAPVFHNTLQTTTDGLRVFSLVAQAWQMQPIDNEPGLYLMRHNASGVGRQLSVCWDPEEDHKSKTIACMQPSSVDDAQKHYFEEIGNTGAFLWKPKSNNSDYAMDVHPGSNLFLNDQIQGETSDAQHPAQRWVFSSARDVNDGAWSTIYSGESAVSSAPPPATTAASTSATSTAAETTPTSADSSPAETSGSSSAANESSGSDGGGGGIPPGAAAGIGVGATLAVLGLIGALVFFFWRRRRAARAAAASGSKPEGGDFIHQMPPSQATTPANGDTYTASNEHKAGAAWGNAYPQGDQQYSAATQHTSPSQDIHSPHSTAYGHQSEPAEAPFQPIHEAPSHQYNELDAAPPRSNGMNSVQQTPATQYAETRPF
ncbi:Isoflavone reductase [Verticillium dahliae VDG2]|nr:Isoflavone reductase [Verticillium dahliae VDG2]